MISNAQENESDWTACEGGSEEAGKSTDPGSLPEDDASANPNEYKEVPVGLPVSDEQYKKMKEAAEKDKPPSGKKGQDDPSA